MLNNDPAPAAVTERVCPLDGAETKPLEMSDLLVCTRCHEMLTPDETVAKATPETWAAYFAAGSTDTDPDDAPLARLGVEYARVSEVEAVPVLVAAAARTGATSPTETEIQGVGLKALNIARDALDDAGGTVSAPGQAEAGEFYVQIDGVDLAVKVEVI